MMQKSLRCFVYGWCSFVPVLGVATCILAWKTAVSVRLKESGEWNPGSRYLVWGAILASIGGLFSLSLFGLIFYQIVRSSD